MSAGTVVGIIGTGLIGGSIGLRARELGWRVLGYDADANASAQALAVGAIDEIVPHEAIYERSTIIVFSAHVQATLDELERLDRNAPAKADLMLDVASVKAPIVRAAQGLQNFVASHPMAGRERSGANAAQAGMFFGKPWLYVPTLSEQLNDRAIAFIAALGALAVAVDPEKHDETVALTSHLPQVLANLFADRLQQRAPAGDLDSYCGPTARELLRLSRSSVAMWRDILRTNRENVAFELRALAHNLQRSADALDRGDVAFIEIATFSRRA